MVICHIIAAAALDIEPCAYVNKEPEEDFFAQAPYKSRLTWVFSISRISASL